MAGGTGTATLDFGSFPGTSEASVVISGLTAISATSKASAFIMADDTSSSNVAEDHRYIPLFLALTCGTPIAATGFTIYGRASFDMQGTYSVRYVWSD